MASEDPSSGVDRRTFLRGAAAAGVAAASAPAAAGSDALRLAAAEGADAPAGDKPRTKRAERPVKGRWCLHYSVLQC